MRSPLADLGSNAVEPAPYPHSAHSGALPDGVCAQLLEELPPLEAITETQDPPSNKGYAMGAGAALEHPDVSPLWRELIGSCISPELLTDVDRLFGEHIRERFPRLEEEAGPLSQMRVGVLHVDSFDQADILLDAEILVTTPVVGEASSSRSPHVDDTTRLFNGQLYFRVPGDEAPGGDVELYTFRDGAGGFTKRDIDPAVLEPVKQIPYERNLFLFMLNSLDAVHAVTPRPPTPSPRYLLNVIAHVERPLFDVEPYQAV